MVCSCGDPTDHEIAHRQLATGERIYFWSDGTVTWGDAGRTMIRTIGRSRDRHGRNQDARANAAIMDLADFIAAADIATAIKAARAFIRKGGTYDDAAKRLRAAVLAALPTH